MRKISAPMTDRPIVTVDADAPDPETIECAVDILRADALVVAPTETRYGLLGRADKAEVVEKVYHVKNRPLSQPIAIFVGSLEMVTHYAELNPPAQFLARLFLPGPLTLVLKGLPEWDSPVARNGRVGIRISPAPVIGEIVERIGFPLTATSANISGAAELSSVDEISRALGAAVDLYLDGGVLDGAPSTVVDCSGDPPKILRKGAVDEKEIRAALSTQKA
jgi:L-threonylcarbamoyladenylate synthase